MPALYVLNRRWRIATDVVPIPTAFACAFNLALCCTAIATFSAFHTCSSTSTSYQILLTSFIAIYGYGTLLDVAICMSGCQGTPLQENPRRAVVCGGGGRLCVYVCGTQPHDVQQQAPLVTLSVGTFWPLHMAMTVYGTVIVHTKEACWPSSGKGIRTTVLAMVYASWASWLLTWCVVWGCMAAVLFMSTQSVDAPHMFPPSRVPHTVC